MVNDSTRIISVLELLICQHYISFQTFQMAHNENGFDYIYFQANFLLHWLAMSLM